MILSSHLLMGIQLYVCSLLGLLSLLLELTVEHIASLFYKQIFGTIVWLMS